MDYEFKDEYQNYSLEAEQSVLGGLLISGHRFHDVSEIVTDNDFYVNSHKLIYRAICKHVDLAGAETLDVLTTINQLEQAGEFENAGGMGYLGEMAQQTPSAANIKAYARIVREKALERDLLQLTQCMQDAIKEPSGTTTERLSNALSLVNEFNHDDSKERSTKEILKAVAHDLQERSQNGGKISGLSTGFDDLDKRLNGLQDTNLIILAARPAMGKTTFALNIAQNALFNEKHGATLIFSMEMSAEEISQKLISSIGSVPIDKMRTGDMDSNEWSGVQAGFAKLHDANLIIDDRAALTIQQVRAKAIREKRKHGRLKLIVLDYLQLMSSHKQGGRTQEVTEISMGLKALAKEIGCPVIALSQLNRNLETRNDRRPRTADLRESGSIEQDADIILFLYRDEVYVPNSNQAGFCEVICSKFRAGEIGTDFLKSDLRHSRFKNLNGLEVPEPEQTTKKGKLEF